MAETTFSWELDFPEAPSVALPPAPPPPPEPEDSVYGPALALLPDGDMDPTSALETNDERILEDALRRRLQTPRGALDFHPGYGLDVTAMLDGQIDEAALTALENAVEAELGEDERVYSTECYASYNTSTEVLTLAMEVTPRTGRTFQFTHSVALLTPSEEEA